MKAPLLFIIALMAMVVCSCNQTASDNQKEQNNIDETNLIEKNKEISTRYHNLNVVDIDIILTEDFIGHGENGHQWSLEEHRSFLSNGVFKNDSIIQQIAEGDWVATRFIRTMDYEGERFKAPCMHFKKIENNKIKELWENWDYDTYTQQ